MKLSFALLFLSAGTANARVGSAAVEPIQHQHQQHDKAEDVSLDFQKELFSSWVTEHKGATSLQSAYKNPEELTRRMNIWMQNHGMCGVKTGCVTCVISRVLFVSFSHDRMNR